MCLRFLTKPQEEPRFNWINKAMLIYEGMLIGACMLVCIFLYTFNLPFYLIELMGIAILCDIIVIQFFWREQ